MIVTEPRRSSPRSWAPPIHSTLRDRPPGLPARGLRRPLGLRDFLEAIADPKHEELLEWIDGPFDPDHLNIEDINKLLTAQ
ncbi:hypothetical protein OS965_41340 [Streptomyces sp. H27-G5]|nr:hypothetical protein [Streptomyces sp. H27-G5]MCY0924458.1 hypothetical protein [Streptomyces sp. H27-G5]